MSKTYTPGEDADAIIARQVAKGNFPPAEAVVRAGVRRSRKAAGEDRQCRRCKSAGQFRKSSDAEAMKADSVSRGEERSRRKT